MERFGGESEIFEENILQIWRRARFLHPRVKHIPFCQLSWLVKLSLDNVKDNDNVNDNDNVKLTFGFVMLILIILIIYTAEMQKVIRIAEINFWPKKISTKKWPKNDPK